MSLGFHPISGAPISGEVVTVAAGSYTLTAQVGDFALTGNSVSLNFGRLLSAQVGDFTLTGGATGLNLGFVATAQVGDFSLTGNDAGLNFGRLLTAQTGDFSLTGNDVVLTYAVSGAYTLTATTGSFALTGNDAVLTYTPLNAYTLTATTGDFGLTGNSAGLAWSGEPVEEPRRGGGGVSRFVQARKRLALQRVLEYLTQPEPTEETKRIIRQVKAGKPIERDEKPPVVMAEVSAEKIAERLIPSRVAAVQSIPDVELQAVIRKAIRMAQERDDEDILLLL